MEGKRLILTLSLKDFLSYGPDGMEIGLEPLNVLIGPNSSGKSNLIEAINVLRSTPKDLTAPIREGGGVSEWLWKGRTNQSSSITAEIGATVDYPQGTMPLRYRLRFTSVAQRLDIVDEAIENAHPTWPDQPDVYFFYRFQDGHPALNVRKSLEEPAGTSAGRAERRLQREDVSPDQSVLSQRK
ncbi:MAG TPA: AAA family ATPase, partial [Chloroflexota bacterium]|nr:AAA family ATPase [Chloroflexota bacterium]